MVHRIFLLSPASCTGKRAGRLIAGTSESELADRLREPEGAPIGDVFAFVSALYFRGKLTYARRFGRAPAGVAPAHVITATRGLLPARASVSVDDLEAFAAGPIDPDEAGYRAPLERTARALEERAAGAELVLLGSIATGKYLEPLLGVFGERLHFPAAFVGRGDMSRGGLMLRAAEAGEELEYVVAAGAPRRGRRPPRLDGGA